ncbi:MAG: hypothetical protein IT464_11880 [Planctomycetes bacterium]|nr:hypothetical protein [Planctomycetota bacterium]
MAVLVLCICACTPAPPAKPPTPRSPEAALDALRTGNLDAIREHLGKGDGFATRAIELQGSLDPAAWLIAMGAHGRQHDLAAAAAVMAARDEHAVRDAIGFSDQALRQDLLNGNHSVATVRAFERNYYRWAAPAADAFDGWHVPSLPKGALAYHVTAQVRVGERDVRIWFGRDQQGMTEMRAEVDLTGGPGQPPRNARRATDPAQLVEPAIALSLDWLKSQSLHEAHLRVLQPDGTLSSARLVRDNDTWALLEARSQTMPERLAELRDSRLQRIQRSASDHALRHAAWPTSRDMLLLRPADWVDPTTETARRGWADFDASPPVGLELRNATEPGDIAVIALHAGPEGRRAITRKGELTWVP